MFYNKHMHIFICMTIEKVVKLCTSECQGVIPRVSEEIIIFRKYIFRLLHQL